MNSFVYFLKREIMPLQKIIDSGLGVLEDRVRWFDVGALCLEGLSIRRVHCLLLLGG